MLRQLTGLWPRPGLLVRFAVLRAVLAVLQGLLLGSLVPILRALLRPEPDLGAALPWLIAGAVGVLVHWLLGIVVTPIGFAASNELAVQLRHRLMGHLTTLPLGWFDSDHKGRFVRTVTSVTTTISRICVVVGGPVITSILVPVTVLAVTFAVDWRLGLVLLVTLPVLFVMLHHARRTNTAVVEDIEVAANEIAGRAIEYGQAQPVLRAAGHGSTGTAAMRDALAEHRRRYASGLNRLLPADLSMNAVIAAGFALTLALSAWLLLDGALGVADAVAVLVLAARFLEPLGTLTGLVGALGALDYLVETAGRTLRITPLPAAADPVREVTGSEVELRDVSYSYVDSEPAVDGVSFRCLPGTTTALVGPSGSGKTTVTRLIARFFDAGSGQVLVGGRDVREYDHATLLERLAIVFQDVYLFDTTIEENLRLARPDATEAELAAAARSARLDEVVERLPDGWDTLVGEGGAQLSGGERQRVSIARAFLKRAPIVLIDEAASALDPENEAAVSAAISELAAEPGRTVLVIAHRPTTLEAADQVVALDGGRVAELGTPAELRQAGGLYDRLFRQYEQARGWRI
ncbi:ABC transporter ATP-binding protein [Amycolatopsis suaedae]|uniref:ABC transporter ATP-binding protein n=1 Tax=Amycolatopsis suaedae TaxID=2510978 RepID=A0A4Q7J157_9PSEU|nr:ABC transporter ATP-binding protein [Amycolatopsis suaedae]RZQ60113.1 ABC transporter ATP-binding protein [Amycolatopsis suaedae]